MTPAEERLDGHTGEPAVRRMNEEDRAPMGMTVRVIIYLVAVHFFAAFLFLLFFLAGG
ncbi:DUF6126 family protein [Streptomyces albireticuli]|uniref:DUF6126 family protein n=1 Tax=Streptomyces albireticuli TaxID=1940 RepID=UPI001472A75E|nr:DUF6126 family protein [Streptomyces albireticuli]MCD9140717.1 DUF6126 family protein [Streptomyces albireticuli]MCD9161321.1 DUF6126 family protein [Streptomyces albireticuli]MCD9190621.1 DUF6126 family protein [Streptomyces albireticuli]